MFQQLYKHNIKAVDDLLPHTLQHVFSHTDNGCDDALIKILKISDFGCDVNPKQEILSG